MRKSILFVMLVAVGLSLCASTQAYGSGDEVSIVQSAIQVLSEIMAIPEQSIPPSLLGEAYGIAIFPGLLKASFIVGARYGEGVMIVRSQERGWSNPVFFKITGGSVGWQIGAQSTDAILVFKTVRSLDAITSGKFTLGADASVAAGPVGRHAEAGTDIQFRAEILSYSRNRGLFAGVALEGAAMQVDYKANSAFYNTAGLLPMQIFMSPDVQAPPVAGDLKRVVEGYSRR